MDSGPLIEMTTGLGPSSPYYLGDGIGHLLAARVLAHEFDDVFLVCGERLRGTIAAGLARQLAEAGVATTLISVPEGEPNKNWERLGDLCEHLVQVGATKGSIILALGGGMVSNLVGLAAGLLYRGVRYVEIPTTLLNLTDGVLSNKQAVNGLEGKNQFGMYYPPLFVWADVSYLRSEPPRQWKSGLTEAIKNGLIDDAGWFHRLAGILTPDLGHVREDLLGVCRSVIASKHKILAADPTERGRAVILEYGHTVGHAVEFLCGIPHGEAVGIGMCAAARIGAHLGITPSRVLDQQEWIIGERLGNATTIPADCAPDRILEVIRSDNKRHSCEEIRFILLDDIGAVHSSAGSFETIVPESLLKSALQES